MHRASTWGHLVQGPTGIIQDESTNSLFWRPLLWILMYSTSYLILIANVQRYIHIFIDWIYVDYHRQYCICSYLYISTVYIYIYIHISIYSLIIEATSIEKQNSSSYNAIFYKSIYLQVSRQEFIYIYIYIHRYYIHIKLMIYSFLQRKHCSHMFIKT